MSKKTHRILELIVGIPPFVFGVFCFALGILQLIAPGNYLDLPPGYFHIPLVIGTLPFLFGFWFVFRPSLFPETGPVHPTHQQLGRRQDSN